jgi:hypothetical protein
MKHKQTLFGLGVSRCQTCIGVEWCPGVGCVECQISIVQLVIVHTDNPQIRIFILQVIRIL